MEHHRPIHRSSYICHLSMVQNGGAGFECYCLLVHVENLLKFGYVLAVGIG